MIDTHNMPPSASQLLQACAQLEKTAGQDGKPPVCFAVVDHAGELLCFHRMDGAPVRLVSIAIGKAYTAARMEAPTLAFQARLNREVLTLADFCDSGLTALPGGVPLRIGAKGFGAVGVSGRALVDDNALAESFVHIIEEICAAKPR
jgi:uncharacterized protein GlcG (DUF336 family)